VVLLGFLVVLAGGVAVVWDATDWTCEGRRGSPATRAELGPTFSTVTTPSAASELTLPSCPPGAEMPAPGTRCLLGGNTAVVWTAAGWEAIGPLWGTKTVPGFGLTQEAAGILVKAPSPAELRTIERYYFIRLETAAGGDVVGIRENGAVEFGPGVTPDHAARDFYDKLGRDLVDSMIRAGYRAPTPSRELARSYSKPTGPHEAVFAVANDATGLPSYVVIIDADGAVTLGEGVTVDEASLQFYKALERTFRNAQGAECARWDGPLADKLRRELEQRGCSCPTVP